MIIYRYIIDYNCYSFVPPLEVFSENGFSENMVELPSHKETDSSYYDYDNITLALNLA